MAFKPAKAAQNLAPVTIYSDGRYLAVKVAFNSAPSIIAAPPSRLINQSPAPKPLQS